MKRLIICCDGTWQKLSSEYPTNVVKITQAIKPIGDDGIPQIIHYSEGIGTGEYFIDQFGGGIFGWGIDQVIQNAYRFLCLNYQAGDQIYLFGFSRGAYTVRSLAGMIYNAGLLNRPHIRDTPHAYKLYRDRSPKSKPSSIMATAFRLKYSQEVDIYFLGCWDTVGSLGIPDQIPWFPLDNWLNQKYQFHDTKINRRIKCARHAAAIDEIRKPYYVTPMHKSEGADTQDLKQIWFPGEHGCVGGGSILHRRLSDSALKWMLEEAAQKGLSLDLNNIENGIVINPTIEFDNSIKGIYLLSGKRIRELNDNPLADQNRYIYVSFDDLHESTKERWCMLDTYRPEGLKVFSA